MGVNWQTVDKLLEENQKQVQPTKVDWGVIDKQIEQKKQPPMSLGETLGKLATLPIQPLKHPEYLTQPIPQSFGGKAPSQVIQESPAFRQRPERFMPAFLRNVAGQVTGGAADIATTPLTYIIPPAMKALTANVPAQTFIRTQLPTLGKGLIQPVTADEWAYQNWLKKPQISLTPQELVTKQLKQASVQEMAGSIRTSKFPSDVRPLLQETVDMFGKEVDAQRRGVLTFNMIKQKAEGIRGKLDLKTLKPGDIVNAETNLAARLQVLDKAQQALATNSKEALMEVYDDIIKLNGLSTEAGRALSAHRIPIMSEFSKGSDFVSTLTSELNKINPTDTEALRKFFKVAVKPGIWDKFMEWRTAGMLTSPYTHERNIIGNIIGRMFAIPEKVSAGGADAVRSFVTGQPRERYIREAGADVVGMVRGIRPAMRSAFNALLDEDFTFSSRTGEALRFGKAIPGVAGRIIRMPFRVLNAMDEFFSSLNTTSSLYTQAYRQALQEGGKDIISRTAELIKNPSLEMLNNASKQALYETFRQPLGKGGMAIQSALIKTKVGKFVVPFFRTPVNLFKWSFDRSPLGLYKLATPQFYKLSQGKMADELGKMAFGQLISAGMAYEAWQGNITGRLSNKKPEREALMRQGIMPYSIKVGDKYYSYKGFEPVASWLGLMANIMEQVKEKNEEPTSQQVTQVALETVKFMREQPFLTGIRDLFNAMDDPERYGQQFVQNVITSSTIPTGIAWATRLQDPTYRETETIPQAIMSRIPGLSKQLQPKLDIWGRPISKEGTLLEKALNPVGGVTYKPDLVEEELLLLGKFPDKIAKKYRGIPLSIDERNIITKIEGGVTKMILDKLVQSPEYKRLDPVTREEIVDKLFRDIRTNVRKPFLKKKIIKDLQGIDNRKEKISYIQKLIEKKIIK